MTPEDMVAEITGLRNGIESGARRIYELSRVLHDRMRRADPNQPSRQVYVTYANVWIRFSGMVQQGLQRTRQTDRVLRLLPQEEVSSPELTPPEAEGQARSVPEPSATEDFISLYGEEYMRDASQW
jgi:hypothetical protein